MDGSVAMEEFEMVMLNGSCVDKAATKDSENREGDSAGFRCVGYRTSRPHMLLFVLLSFLTCGLLLLVTYWKPEWRLRLTSQKTSNAMETDWVLLEYNDGRVFVERVIDASLENHGDFHRDSSKSFRMKAMQNRKRRNDSESAEPLLDNEGSHWEGKGKVEEEGDMVYFIHRYERSQYDPLTRRAVVMRGIADQTCQSIWESKGLTEEEVIERQMKYGRNSAVVEVTPYWRLLIEEVLNPFYIFQWVTVIFWCLEEYYSYSVAILLISFISVGVGLYQARKQLEELRKMAPEPSVLTVIRNGSGHVSVVSDELVPGDLIEIPINRSFEMPCDAALICGTCRVNESMLTGESTTITKTEMCLVASEPAEARGSVTDDSDEERTLDKNLANSMAPVDSVSTREGGLLAERDIYDASSPSCKRHTLYCGTTIVGAQPRDGCVLAVVVKIGFSTEKGKLLRSILFPSEVKFEFFRDAIRFVGILCVLAAAGFIYSCVQFVKYHDGIEEILFRAFDLITIVVPPGLPAAMTVGTIYAVKRLKKQKICCTSPAKVNISGKIKLVCFDKTGTLTEDNMTMKAVVSYDKQSSQVWQRISAENFPQRSATIDKQLLVGMGTCHELSVSGSNRSGPAEDKAMFELTGWVVMKDSIVTPSSVGQEALEPDCYTILTQNPFESGLKRMSVIVRADAETKSEHLVFVKGAPEVICSLCRRSGQPKSDKLKQELSYWTKQGCRVLALAWKRLKTKSPAGLKRVQVERNLKFLGLLVMTSDLKEMTEPVISELHDASIRTVMVTGDYMDTAVSIARRCGMVLPEDELVCVEPTCDGRDIEYRSIASRKRLDSGQNGHCSGHVKSAVVDVRSEVKEQRRVYAMTGESFRMMRDQYKRGDNSKNHRGVSVFDDMLVRGVVFARMGPGQKKELVEDLQSLGYCLCMCGDGANDCEALRAADAGISLSKAEASVAAPFTSQVADIRCVPTLIREGRAALVTTFSVFKYMAAYSLIEFTTVLILYTLNSNLGDRQYFYIDLVVVLILALVGERTEAYKGRLDKKSPLSSLVSFPVLFSLLSQIAVQIFLLTLTYKYLESEPWFTPLVQVINTENTKCYETTALFCLCSFLLINVSVAFAEGAPYRSPMYTNGLYVGSVIVLYLITAYITLWPANFVADFLELEVPSSLTFRVALVEISILGLVLSYIIDRWVISSNALKQLCGKLWSNPTPRYVAVENEIRNREM